MKNLTSFLILSLFILAAIMVYTNLDKFDYKRNEVLYYGLSARDGIHIEICKWPRPTKLISWSGHDNEFKMVTGMRIAPWRQDIPSMKLFISGLTVNRSVELGEVTQKEIGGVRSLVMNLDEYRIIWQNVKGTDEVDVPVARLFNPSGSSVIVDLRQRTGMPPEAFPNHQEHDPRHDAAWSPWLSSMRFSEWTSVSISGKGIRRTLFSAKFENGWQDTLMVYDDNGMSDKRPLVWEPVQDIIPTADEEQLGYWLVTMQGSWFDEVMDAILSRHPTLAEISKRDKIFMHESLIAVALWKNQNFKWKERVTAYGLVNAFDDLYPAASYMISLGAGVAMGKGEPGRWTEPGRLWKEVTFEKIVRDPRGAPMWIIPKDWETVQYVFAIQGLVHRGGTSVSSHGIVEIGACAGLVIDPTS